MRIKEVEELVGITKKNIRFYEKEGLLHPGRELENSYRDYTQEDVERLRTIKLLRRLDMPLSEISDVLEGRISLREALHLHALLLEEQRNNIMCAQRMCRRISEEGAELDTLDTARYLEEMDRLEQGSPVFVNVGRRDTVRKYRESVIVSVIIIAILAALAAFLLYLNKTAPTPRGVIVYFLIVIAIVVAGTVAALISRIKEIKGGEENDLGNY